MTSSDTTLICPACKGTCVIVSTWTPIQVIHDRCGDVSPYPSGPTPTGERACWRCDGSGVIQEATHDEP